MEHARLFEDVFGTNKSFSLSCVFTSWSTADTWLVIKHKPCLPESAGSSPISTSNSADHATGITLPTRYLLMSWSPDWIHSTSICWALQHFNSRYMPVQKWPAMSEVPAWMCFSPDTSRGWVAWLNHLWVETSRDASWEQRGFVRWTLCDAHREVNLLLPVGHKFSFLVSVPMPLLNDPSLALYSLELY